MIADTAVDGLLRENLFEPTKSGGFLEGRRNGLKYVAFPLRGWVWYHNDAGKCDF